MVITSVPHSIAVGLHCLYSLKFSDAALLWHLPLRMNSSDLRNSEILRKKIYMTGVLFCFGFSLFCLSGELSLLRDFKVLGGLEDEEVKS